MAVTVAESKGAVARATAVRMAAVRTLVADPTVVAARARAEVAMEARREVAEAAEVHLLEALGVSREPVAAWTVMAGQVRPPRGMA